MAVFDDVSPIAFDDGLVYTTGVKNTEDPLILLETYESDGVIRSYKQMVKSSIGGLIGRDPEANSEHMLYAMDTQDGEIVWEKPLGKGSYGR